MDEYLTDGLLIEILLWLPLLPLYDFKRVSKRWYEIISSSYFKELYRKRNNRIEENDLSSLLGFYITGGIEQAFFPTTSARLETFFPISSSPCVPDSDWFKIIYIDRSSFIAFSNGCMIFGNHYWSDYYLSNYTQRKLHLFPKPRNTHKKAATGFHFDYAAKTFVLVRIGLSDFPSYSSTCHMEIITCGDRAWKKSIPSHLHITFQIRPFECAVHVNGVFYWLELNNRIVAYEYSCRRCYCIPLPETDPYVVERSAMLGESKDGQVQYGRSNCFGIRVWVLEDCVTIIGIISPRWVMRHNLSFMLLRHLCDLCPDLLSSCDLILNKSILQNERFANVPLLLAFHEPEFIFLRLGNSVLVYCLVQQKLEQVSIQSSGGIVPLQDNCRKVFPFFWPTWFTNRLKKNFVESRNLSAEYLLSLKLKGEEGGICGMMMQLIILHAHLPSIEY